MIASSVCVREQCSHTGRLFAKLIKISAAMILNAVVDVIGFHKSTLVARGANTQLDPSCVSALLATKVDLFVCFAERLFKSSSISH